MDKMFDSSFRYGVSSFPLHDTSSRFVVFRVPFAVLRSRLIASGVRHLVFSSSNALFDSSFYAFNSSLTTSLRRCVVLLFRHGVSSFRCGVSSFRLVHSERLQFDFNYIKC